MIICFSSFLFIRFDIKLQLVFFSPWFFTLPQHLFTLPNVDPKSLHRAQSGSGVKEGLSDTWSGFRKTSRSFGKEGGKGIPVTRAQRSKTVG